MSTEDGERSGRPKECLRLAARGVTSNNGVIFNIDLVMRRLDANRLASVNRLRLDSRRYALNDQKFKVG
ncbi:hypothetical protein GWI33_021845 [Rhynchophorus ferrugineus]|uniref:Uncharacterized protein n=1 Tax=Rhynchophorus ferrugineus TaxID=354439 RepID=A0A834IQX1_RHYFE|nr:hypothetical protein GWI33_021845 [Rhynchophorus ferrugineus]